MPQRDGAQPGERVTNIRKAELYGSLVPPAWYAVCADREYRARDGLIDRGIETWLPECRVVVSRRRTRTVEDGPLFPGYLFVRGVLTDDWLHAVLGVKDVEDLLRSSSSRPAPACEREMAKLQRLMAEHGGRILIEAGRVKRGFNHPADEPSFKPGEFLRVIDGPFTGFNALCRAQAGTDRIKIMLDIFGRATETEIHETSVEAVA